MEEFSVASGISRPTLSKYFSDPSSVRSTTRQRIEEALQEFNYRPNIFAISQNRKKPKNIGVLVPHISDPFYAEIVCQIEKRCVDEGYWAIILSSYGDKALEAKAVQMLLSLKLSGAIVAPLGLETNGSMIRSLADAIPLVILDSRIDDVSPFIGTDNRQSIALMVEYLCRTGEHPCYLDMPIVNQNAVDRREAYIQAMTMSGLEPNIITVDSKTWNFEEVGFEEASAILDKGGFPTRTVLCANDRLAFGVIAAAYQKGLRVGREPDCDLRVAGHDDHPLSRFTTPPLTTVAQDYQSIATVGVDMLLDLIHGRGGQSDAAGNVIKLEAKLIMRGSA